MRILIVTLIGAFAGCGYQTSTPPTAPARAALPPAQPLSAEQLAESPGYSRWSKFPVGTSVRIEESHDLNGQTTVSTTAQKLMSLTDDVAVVETVNQLPANSAVAPENATVELKHPRWMVKPTGKAADDPGQPQGTYATGAETISVRGKKYKTVWYKSKGHVEAGETDTQAWICSDVPGGIVKSVFQIPKVKATITAELVEVRNP